MRLQLNLEAKNVKPSKTSIIGYVAKIIRLDNDELIGETEILFGYSSLKWSKVFYINHEIESNFYLKVEIWNGTNNLGYASFSLNDVVETTNRGKKCENEINEGCGLVRMWAQESGCEEDSIATCQFRGLDIRNVDLGLLQLGKASPFFKLSKKHIYPSPVNDSRWQVVYQSERIERHLNPVWKEFSLNFEDLCNGNKHMTLKIEFYGWQKNGNHKKIGEVETTFGYLVSFKTTCGNADRTNALLLRDSYDDKYGDNYCAGSLVVLEAMNQSGKWVGSSLHQHAEGLDNV